MAIQHKPMINPAAVLGRPKRRPALLALLLLFIGLPFGFKALLDQLEDTVRLNIQANLVTIGELKVGQILGWLAEARKDTEFLLTRPSIIDPLDQWLLTESTGQPLDRGVANRLEDFCKHGGFKALVLFDAEGHQLMRDQAGLVYSGHADLARRVVSENQWRLVNFYRQQDGQAELGLIMPVHSPHGDRAIAALLVVLDPIRFLYPLIKSWPVASETSETLLVKADNARVQFLNPLRFAPDAALTLSLPLNDPDLPAAMAARGEYGVAEGVDYRGKKVLSYTAPVPETPWNIVAKVDLDEAYEPLNRMSGIAGGVLGLFMLLLTGIVWLFWRDRRFRYVSALLREQTAREISEGKFKAIFDHSADGILVARLSDQRLILGNPAICRMLGYSASEVERLGVTDIHPTDALPGILQQFARFSRDELLSVANVPLLCKDDKVVWADVNGARITLGGEACVIGLFRDIAPRRTAEAALLESKARYDELVRVIPVGTYIFRINAEGATSFDYVSPRFCQLLDVDAEAVLADVNVAYAVAHPEDLGSLMQTIEEARKTLQPFLWEGRYVVRGEIRWVRVESNPKPLPGGDSLWNGVLIDITEPKQAEEDLRESEERFRLFLNHNPIIAWLIDEQGRYVYLNETYENHFGVQQYELLGKAVFEVWPDEIARKLSTIDRAVLDSWKPVELIEHTHDSEGVSAYWMTFKFPFQNAGGDKFVGGVGIDVTARIQAEKAIEQLNATLRQTNIRLQGEIEAERKRIAFALHDEIGQGLTALSLYLHRLTKRVEGDETSAQIAEKMEQAVVALGESIRRALTDLRPVLLDQVGLSVAIRTLVREFETAHEVAVDLTLEGDVSDVSPGGATVFYRFLQECLTNIAKHANATEVQVTFRYLGDDVTLEVSDNGCGFGAGQPSYGLLGMQERASEVGGRVTVESAAPGRGARLTLSVPLRGSKPDASQV